MDTALRHYQSQQRASKNYYQNHREEINEKRRLKYKEQTENFPPKKRGRPRKVVEPLE